MRYINRLRGFVSDRVYALMLGFLLFIALPASIMLVQKQQYSNSKAAASTVVYFEPASSPSLPLTKAQGDTFPLDIMVNPGNNAVSVITLVIQYDPSRFSVNQTGGLVENSTVFSQVLEGPVYSEGQVAMKLSIGSDPTRAVKQTAKAATLQLTAIGGTGSVNTEISFTSQTSALSVGANDTTYENVISTTQPAVISIGGNVPSVTTGPTVEPTDIPSVEPTEIIPGQPTSEPTVKPSVKPSVKPTGSGHTLTPYPSSSVSNKFHGLKNSIIRIITNKIRRCEKTNSKIQSYTNLSYVHKAQLKTEFSASCDQWKTLLQQVTRAQNEKEIRQAAYDLINLIAEQYSGCTHKLGIFNKGLGDTFSNTTGSTKHNPNIRSVITKIDSNLGDISMTTGKIHGKANGIHSESTTENIKSTFSSVKKNISELKTGFSAIKNDMQNMKTSFEQKIYKD